jgi:hypothetical protein
MAFEVEEGRYNDEKLKTANSIWPAELQAIEMVDSRELSMCKSLLICRGKGGSRSWFRIDFHEDVCVLSSLDSCWIRDI